MLRSFQRLDFDATVCLPGGFRDRNIQRPLTKICPNPQRNFLSWMMFPSFSFGYRRI
jgi:hypothetical protein